MMLILLLMIFIIMNNVWREIFVSNKTNSKLFLLDLFSKIMPAWDTKTHYKIGPWNGLDWILCFNFNDVHNITYLEHYSYDVFLLKWILICWLGHRNWELACKGVLILHTGAGWWNNTEINDPFGCSWSTH